MTESSSEVTLAPLKAATSARAHAKHHYCVTPGVGPPPEGAQHDQQFGTGRR